MDRASAVLSGSGRFAPLRRLLIKRNRAIQSQQDLVHLGLVVGFEYDLRCRPDWIAAVSHLRAGGSPGVSRRFSHSPPLARIARRVSLLRIKAASAIPAVVRPAVEMRADLIEEPAPVSAGNIAATAAGTIDPHILLFGRKANCLTILYRWSQV